jgi:isopropylmalate/homocitrate/citramalate synthase
MTRKFALGKHSGKASIKHKLEQLGLSASSETVEAMRVEVNRVGEAKKGNLTDDDFMAIYKAVSGSSRKSVAAVDVAILSGLRKR